MSSGPSLGEAVLHLVGDESELINTTQGAKTKVDDILGKVGSGYRAVGNGITATANVISAVGGTVLSIAAKAGAAADDLLVGATKTGVTVEEYQKLKYAAELVDVPIETMTSSMAKFTNIIGEGVAGNEEIIATFKLMGVALYDQEGQLRSVYDIWLDTIDGLGGVENATEQNILAQNLLGRSYIEVKPLIEAGSEALKAYGKEAEASGAILNQSQVEALGNVDDAIQEMKGKLSGIFLGIMADNVPQLEGLITTISNLLVSIVPLVKSIIQPLTAILTWLANLPPGVTKAIAAIAGIILIAGQLIPIIGTVFSVVSSLSAFLAGPAVAAIGAVMVPILPIIAIIAAVIAVIALLYAAWKNNWFGIRDITANVINGIVNFWNNKFIPAIKSVADFIGNVLGGAFNAVKNAIMGVWDWIQNLMGSLTNIKLPDWMTPGSPTPWEIGLRGVSSAMGELDAERLPGLSTALANLNSGAAAGPALPGMLGTNIGAAQTKNISFTINNPIGETTDDSMSRGLKRLQFLGMA